MPALFQLGIRGVNIPKKHQKKKNFKSYFCFDTSKSNLQKSKTHNTSSNIITF